MTERKPLSISVDMNTNKLQLKLRAIAKHTEQLANELDAIDNAWMCECGCADYQEEVIHNYKEDAHFIRRTCHQCKTDYAMPLDKMEKHNEIKWGESISKHVTNERYPAVTDYLKELEALLLHNGIPLPSTREDVDLPIRFEGSE